MGFTADLKRFSDKAEKDMNRFCRLIALDLHKRVVTRSPVDTGRFKANNQVSLNGLPSDSQLSVDKGGGATITSGSNEIARFNLGDTIFLYNNVAYAMRLEFGHSKQAPTGIYRISLKDVVSEGNIKLLARKAQQ